MVFRPDSSLLDLPDPEIDREKINKMIIATRYSHDPVMVNEVIEHLALKPKSLIVDATIGGGGHAKEILSKHNNIKLLGIDQDAEAIEAARKNLEAFGDRIELIQDNFSNIKSIIGSRGSKVNGILFDLGISSYQIDTPQRGFSFQADAPLDMRMDISKEVTAKDLINNSERESLENIIKNYGEERYYRRIVTAIIKKRPVSTTLELARIVKYSIPRTSPLNATKSTARVFQAFRIAVNNELDNLKKALNGSIDILAPKGRIVVISYHSLEDRIVKDLFRTGATGCICPPRLPKCVCSHKKMLKIITKKPMTPNDREMNDNPRSRSAKLRAAEKI